jgi:hypothetical protein
MHNNYSYPLLTELVDEMFPPRKRLGDIDYVETMNISGLSTTHIKLNKVDDEESKN